MAHGPGPLLVLYGSNSGTAESFAKQIGSEAATRGYAPIVAPADDSAFRVPVDMPFIVVTASYEGQPPNNAGRFVAWAESLQPDTLKGRPFAVVGCGNRHWARTGKAAALSTPRMINLRVTVDVSFKKAPAQYRQPFL